MRSLAADDVWATGNVQDSAGGTTTYEPLLLHWDGRAWSFADAPPNAGARASLVRTGDELWSLGERPLHFDGTGWHRQDGPPAGVSLGGTELADGRLLTVGYPDVTPFRLGAPELIRCRAAAVPGRTASGPFVPGTRAVVLSPARPPPARLSGHARD